MTSDLSPGSRLRRCASIEARQACSTGISAADRATTCRGGRARRDTPADLVMPGT
jgi:3,4-dihydroxy-2-butanone 4-phosphate synthase